MNLGYCHPSGTSTVANDTKEGELGLRTLQANGNNIRVR
jgi:3-oxoacyl-(acyl-carrier-protein) synthase